MQRILCGVLALCLLALPFTGCAGGAVSGGTQALPAPLPDPGNAFGIDQNINMDTIDQYLNRDDVCYRDLRMLFDPADFEAIGGEADLTRTIAGFRVTPYPYLASLPGLPVEGAYGGPCLYTLTWNKDGSVASATPNYEESELILTELFPKDKAIFLMCGGGGYADVMRSLLICLGWNEKLLYNVGANWNYAGENKLELIVYPEDANDTPIYATWRADYAYIAFEKLHPVKGE